MVAGGGWCFYSAVFVKLCSDALPDLKFVAVFVFEALAGREAEFVMVIGGVDYDGLEVAKVRDVRALFSWRSFIAML